VSQDSHENDETIGVSARWPVNAVIAGCRVLRQLGAGGMGEVYLAEDLALERRVAFKFLAPHHAASAEARARFEREARAMAAISHPNVVTIHQVGEAEGRPYLLMEYVEGRSLKELLKEEALNVEHALDLALQLASGLARVHERGIVHRDVKPSNILIDRDGRPRLLDFGLATAPEGDDLTRAGEALGTIRYMSPEQAEARPTDPRSDLFSLGVVLYEMLAGRAPFGGDSLASIVRAILHEEPERLSLSCPELPEGIERLVDRLLEKDPAARASDAAAVVAEIQGLRGGSSATTASYRTRPVPREASVAVLPFVNMSADAEQEYFCDGMTEELIAALTKVEGLRVPARTSCFAFKGKKVGLREIARQLGVATILEGSVRKAGTRLRITAQLVDVAEDRPLWSERYDRELEDVFAIQDEVTLAIVERLTPHLIGKARERAEDRPERNIEAYNLLLKGRFFANRRSAEGLRKAVESFEQSVEVDPSFAQGYAELAFGHITMAGYAVIDPAEGYRIAREVAERAVALDPDLSAAHCALGTLEWEERRDRSGAEKALRRALRNDPEHVHSRIVLAEIHSALGQHDEAIALSRKVAESDPLSPVAMMWLATSLHHARRLDEAEVELARARELDPDFLPVLAESAEVAVERGRHEEALVAAARAVGLASEEPKSVALWGWTCARCGRETEARAALESLERIAGRRYVPSFELAVVHTGLGETEKALELLEQALDELYWRILFLGVDSRLDPLRSHPRFERIVDRLGIAD
jgi:serine/threonine-protein kinase